MTFKISTLTERAKNGEINKIIFNFPPFSSRYFDEQECREIESSENYLACDENSDDEINPKQQQQHPKRSHGLRIIEGLPETRASVLIFVPGMEQIKQLQELISAELAHSKLLILPLHSDIVIEEQNRVFFKAETAWRKVIISTKIAESSITVPDVKYVIDFGLTKEIYCDPATNYTQLRIEWASRASMRQRKGRAGRVSDGVCYRLISRAFEKHLEDYSVPAILREPLDKVLLNVKRLNQPGEPKKILSLAIEAPRLTDIDRTLLSLKEVGALTLRTKAAMASHLMLPSDGDLTYVGFVMSNLPIDVRLSKLILLGHVFGKLREAIIIAAGLSVKSFFTIFYKSYLEAFK